MVRNVFILKSFCQPLYNARGRKGPCNYVLTSNLHLPSVSSSSSSFFQIALSVSCLFQNLVALPYTVPVLCVPKSLVRKLRMTVRDPFHPIVSNTNYRDSRTERSLLLLPFWVWKFSTVESKKRDKSSQIIRLFSKRGIRTVGRALSITFWYTNYHVQ